MNELANLLRILPNETGGQDSAPFERVEHELLPWEKRCHALADAPDKNQTQRTCANDLRQTMTDMGMQMKMVESSGNFDEDFVRLMLPHHEAAIEMAKVELRCGKDQINRRLAQEIIADQQSEIELMRLWLSNHETTVPPPAEPQKEEKKQ